MQEQRPIIKKERLTRDFRGSGIESGDLIGVHSSLSSIGWVTGGPATVIRALMEVVGAEGTILMPTFCRPQELFILSETPSRTGLITETFRKWPGVIRSPHPTHSVTVWGRYAKEIAAGHETAGALSVDSPFHRQAKLGGKILFIGADMRSCSLVHVAESIVKVPYLKVYYPGYNEPLPMLFPDGTRKIYQEKEPPGDSSGFLVVVEELKKVAYGDQAPARRRRGLVCEGKIGQAKSMLILAQDILDVAMELLKKDAASLLCNKPRCPVCPQSRRLVEESLRQK